MSTYSLEHKEYLKKVRKEKFLVYITQGSIIICFFLIWEILSQLNLINTFLFSSPSNIISTISSLISTNNFLNHILVTLYEIFISCSVSFIVGFFIATFGREFKIVR